MLANRKGRQTRRTKTAFMVKFTIVYETKKNNFKGWRNVRFKFILFRKKIHLEVFFMDSKLEILFMYIKVVIINNFGNVLVDYFYNKYNSKNPKNKRNFLKRNKKKVIKTIDIFVQFLRSCYCYYFICDYRILFFFFQ